MRLCLHFLCIVPIYQSRRLPGTLTPLHLHLPWKSPAEPLVAFPVSAPAQVPTKLAQSPDVYEEQPPVHSAPTTPVTATSDPPSEDTAPRRRSRCDRHMLPKLNDYIVDI